MLKRRLITVLILTVIFSVFLIATIVNYNLDKDSSYLSLLMTLSFVSFFFLLGNGFVLFLLRLRERTKK